jgi:hypothetical protein
MGGIGSVQMVLAEILSVKRMQGELRRCEERVGRV